MLLYVGTTMQNSKNKFNSKVAIVKKSTFELRLFFVFCIVVHTFYVFLQFFR